MIVETGITPHEGDVRRSAMSRGLNNSDDSEPVLIFSIFSNSQNQSRSHKLVNYFNAFLISSIFQSSNWVMSITIDPSRCDDLKSRTDYENIQQSLSETIFSDQRCIQPIDEFRIY
jgi:hypothetical protein